MQAITRLRDGLDEMPATSICKVPAQQGDTASYAFIAGSTPIPRLINQRIPGDDLTLVLHQAQKHIANLRLQVLRVPIGVNLTGAGIKRYIPDTIDRHTITSI
jgi:hypothetical protein